MTKQLRCRYSEHARQYLKPMYPDKEGDLLGTVRGRPEHLKVRWDGNKTIVTFHKDFIEIVKPPGGAA